MNIIETVFWGAVSGIITALVIGIVQRVITQIVVPWIEDHRYKSVRLDGEWQSEFHTDEFDSFFRLTLKQNANRFTGTLQIEKKSKISEPSETLFFNVEGALWEGFLSLTTKSLDYTRLAFGSDLYQIKEGGRKLDGIHLYRSLRRDCVAQAPLTFSKRS